MNSAPPLLAGVIVVFVAVVLVGRWALVDESAADKLINRAMTWDVGAVVSYACCAVVGHADLGQRLFLGVGMMALSNCLGFVVLINGADPRAVFVRQRRYNAGAAVFVAGVVVLAVGEELGWHVHRLVPWETILWGVTCVFIGWVGVVLIRACLRELRTDVSTTRERLTYGALLGLGCYCVISSVLAVQGLTSGAPPGNPGTLQAVGSFLACALLALLIGVPMVEAVLVRMGLDQTGRDCRRLQPLWRDLTAAVPEVVLPADPPDRGGSSSRLYRMTVEIRDALLHLKQFISATDEAGANDIGAYALRIAAATHLRQQGMPTGQPGAAVQLPAADRATELRNLLALAREWPRARAAAAHRITASQG